MSTRIQHYLDAERILRQVEHMFPDDPNVATGLAKAHVHALLACAPLGVEVLSDEVAGAIADLAVADGIARGHIDPSEQHL